MLVDLGAIRLDRGYISELTRGRLAEREITDAVIAKRRKPGAGGENEASADGPSLAGRVHQLLALELQPATPQHGPQSQESTRAARPRRRLPAGRKADRLEKTLVTGHLAYPLTLFSTRMPPVRAQWCAAADASRRYVLGHR